MSDTTDRIRAHYDGPGLVDRIEAAPASIAPEDQPLTVGQLAALDPLHTRGVAATAELAVSAGPKAGDTMLDPGCGIGGPARCMAATFGCRVTENQFRKSPGRRSKPGANPLSRYPTATRARIDRFRTRVPRDAHRPARPRRP
jgi:hypothetical protein